MATPAISTKGRSILSPSVNPDSMFGAWEGVTQDARQGNTCRGDAGMGKGCLFPGRGA
jgi:hypothetical protein